MEWGELGGVEGGVTGCDYESADGSKLCTSLDLKYLLGTQALKFHSTTGSTGSW